MKGEGGGERHFLSVHHFSFFFFLKCVRGKKGGGKGRVEKTPLSPPSPAHDCADKLLVVDVAVGVLVSGQKLLHLKEEKKIEIGKEHHTSSEGVVVVGGGQDRKKSEFSCLSTLAGGGSIRNLPRIPLPTAMQCLPMKKPSIILAYRKKK